MMIFLRIYLFSIFLMSFVLTEPLKPGEPGGPWTEEEIDIVRDKVISYLTTVSNEDLGS